MTGFDGRLPHQIRLERRRRLVGLVLLPVSVARTGRDRRVGCLPRPQPGHGLAVRGRAGAAGAVAARGATAPCGPIAAGHALSIGAGGRGVRGAAVGGLDRGRCASRARWRWRRSPAGSWSPSGTRAGSGSGSAAATGGVVVPDGQRPRRRADAAAVGAGHAGWTRRSGAMHGGRRRDARGARPHRGHAGRGRVDRGDRLRDGGRRHPARRWVNVDRLWAGALLVGAMATLLG